MTDAVIHGRKYGLDTYSAFRQLPEGVLPVADWLDAMIARGKGWNVTIGAFSTPIVGGGNGTVLDIDQPEGVISVPEGWVMRPVRVHVQCQPPLIAADADESEILIAVDSQNAAATDGTFTSETARNLRTDISTGCPLVTTSAYTADVTDPTLDIELARAVVAADVQGTAADADFRKLELLYEPRNPPFLVGPCSLWIYWGGTVATSGFAQVNFVAFPSSLLQNLD